LFSVPAQPRYDSAAGSLLEIYDDAGVTATLTSTVAERSWRNDTKSAHDQHPALRLCDVDTTQASVQLSYRECDRMGRLRAGSRACLRVL
jgi:hypothetical protein